MTPQDKIKIINLRSNGSTPTEISKLTGISINTIKSYFQRHQISSNIRLCMECGKELELTSKKKTKRFCNDKCRMKYWNTHLNKVKRYAYYNIRCRCCGKEFLSYGNKKRKYCSRTCYYKSIAKKDS